MAKLKLTDDQIKILSSLGFEGKTDEDVRPAIIEKLKEFEVDDVDEDPIEDLIGIVEAFMDIEETPAPKKVEKPKVKNPEPEAEKEESEEEEADEETPAPKKADTKKVVEEEEESSEEAPEEEEEETPAPKPKKKVVAKKKASTKVKRIFYDGREEDHVKKMKKLLKPLEAFGFELNCNQSCIAICLKESDSKRSIMTVESIAFLGEDTVFKTVFNGMNLFKKNHDLLELMEENLNDDFIDRLVVKNNSYPFVKAVKDTEVDDLFDEKLLNMIIEKLQSFDKRLRKNRKRMEESFEEGEE